MARTRIKRRRRGGRAHPLMTSNTLVGRNRCGRASRYARARSAGLLLVETPIEAPELDAVVQADTHLEFTRARGRQRGVGRRGDRSCKAGAGAFVGEPERRRRRDADEGSPSALTDPGPVPRTPRSSAAPTKRKVAAARGGGGSLAGWKVGGPRASRRTPRRRWRDVRPASRRSAPCSRSLRRMPKLARGRRARRRALGSLAWDLGPRPPPGRSRDVSHEATRTRTCRRYYPLRALILYEEAQALGIVPKFHPEEDHVYDIRDFPRRGGGGGADASSACSAGTPIRASARATSSSRTSRSGS